MNELLLRQPLGTFVHLFSVSRESENVLFIQDYRINQGCATMARKTHIFHIVSTNPQHVDRNGQEHNEWKKGKIDPI